MAGEKYIVATAENPVQIGVRNILNPNGYLFLGNCSDSISLMRLVRSYQPDFIIADISLQLRELKQTLETVEDEMLCACILIGDYKGLEVSHLLEKSKILSYCPMPLTRELLLHSVDMSMISYRRVAELDKKLKEVTESYETRKLVERAKWILMERDRISEKEAYERMRRKSMDNRVSMKAIAEAVIFTHEITNKNGR
jgi:two-component system, response regulator PdtaR